MSLCPFGAIRCTSVFTLSASLGPPRAVSRCDKGQDMKRGLWQDGCLVRQLSFLLPKDPQSLLLVQIGRLHSGSLKNPQKHLLGSQASCFTPLQSGASDGLGTALRVYPLCPPTSRPVSEFAEMGTKPHPLPKQPPIFCFSLLPPKYLVWDRGSLSLLPLLVIQTQEGCCTS